MYFARKLHAGLLPADFGLDEYVLRLASEIVVDFFIVVEVPE